MNQNNRRSTDGSGSIFKTIIVGAIGTVVSYYATAWAKKMLEEKPLKTRLREGKEKAVQLKDSALNKATELKDSAMMKAGEMKATAKVKADELIEEKEVNQFNSTIDKKDFE